MFTRLFVDFAYFLQTSRRYKHFKKFFYNLLENANYRYKRYFDIFMIFLIFLSVFVLIREVKSHVNDFLMFFNNYIVSVIFFIEYILRVWVYSDSSEMIVKQYEKDLFLHRDFRLLHALKKVIAKKFEYMKTPSAIIDFLAIMPFFHELRLLRLFILFRVFKLFRYTHSLRSFFSVLSSKKFEFITLLTFATIVVFISSVIIYVMEANNPESAINTLFDAFYWSVVTISTVGFGDITPVSHEGKMVAVVIIISGIGVMSFATSIVVSSFTEKLDEIKESKYILDANKQKNVYLVCGYKDVAVHVCHKLKRLGKQIIILDADEERAKMAQHSGFIALAYDPGNLESYRKLGLNFKHRVQEVLTLQENDVLNIYAILTIRSFDKDIKITSILNERNNRKKLKLAGVDEVIYTQEIIGRIAKQFSSKPIAFEAIHTLQSEHLGLSIEEIIVDEMILQYRVFIKDLFLEHFRVILIGIYQNKSERFYFNPMGDFLLSEDDILIVMGEKSLIQEFRYSLHKKVKR